MTVRTNEVPLVAAVACLGLFLPLALPGDRLIGQTDFCDYQVPVHQFVREEIRAGRFPLWIPHIGCGTPLHASQQAALCYPLLTPLVVLFPAAYALRLSLFLHLLVGFAGEYRLARRFGCSPSASALAALWLVCGGFIVAHLTAGHVNLVFEAALLPWFFLALLWLLRDPGPRSASALAVLATLFVFIGHPQVPLYALLFGLLWAFGSLVAGTAARRRGRVVGWGAAATLVAGLLSLVQILPILELYRDGAVLNERAQASEEVRSFLSVRWIDLLGFVSPNSTGNPYADIPIFRAYPALYHEKAAYLGLAPLFLAVFALSRARIERWQWGCVGLCLFAVVIALGDQTPLFALLCRVVPGLGMLRCQGRVFAVSSVFFSLLAARGLDAFLSQEPGRRRGGLLVLGSAALAILFGTILWFTRPVWQLYLIYLARNLLLECLATVLFLAIAVLVFLRGARLRAVHPQLVCALLLLSSLGDLWYFQLRHFQLLPPEPLTLPEDAQAPLRLAVDSTDYNLWRYSGLIRAAIERHGSTPATNEGGVLPQALERLHRAFLKPNTQPAAIALCGADWIVDPDTGAWRRARGSLPRIRLCQGAEVLEPFPKAASRRLEAAVLEAPRTGSVRVLVESSQKLALAATVTEPEWLIVADTYYPGWVCRVDGAEVPIEAAHGCFRAVHLDSGEHQVEFHYCPRSFQLGLMGSVIGVLFLGALLWYGVFTTETQRHRENPMR